jgi:hypothetical protein
LLQHANAVHDAIATVSTLGEGACYLVPSLLVFMIARFIVRRPAIAARELFVFLGVAQAREEKRRHPTRRKAGIRKRSIPRRQGPAL